MFSTCCLFVCFVLPCLYFINSQSLHKVGWVIVHVHRSSQMLLHLVTFCFLSLVHYSRLWRNERLLCVASLLHFKRKLQFSGDLQCYKFISRWIRAEWERRLDSSRFQWWPINGRLFDRTRWWERAEEHWKKYIYIYIEPPRRGPTPYPIIYHFWQKRYPFRIPSIDQWCPFHITTLHLFLTDVLMNCLLSINKSKPKTFSRLFHRHKMLFTDWNSIFPYSLIIPQLVKSLPFHTDLKFEKGTPFGRSLPI